MKRIIGFDTLQAACRTVWFGKFPRMGEAKAAPPSSLKLDLRQDYVGTFPFNQWVDMRNGYELMLDSPRWDFPGRVSVRKAQSK